MSISPKELNAQLAVFKKEMGTRDPSISVFIDDDVKAEPIHVAIYPMGMNHDRALAFWVADWSDVMPALREKWAAYRAKYDADLIRKIALAIIEITATNGECTDAALRGTYRFSDEEVRRFGGDAVLKANAMADKGPFSIVTMAGANAA